MDIQQLNKTQLEPIREESETEDEMEESEQGGEEEEEEEEEDVETKEVMADDESEEDDDDASLRVLRPRRLSRSLSQESFPKVQSTNNHQEETVNLSKSDWSSLSVDLSDEASSPQQTRLGSKKMSTSDDLRIKVSKVILKAPKASVQKKKMAKEVSLVEKPFPEWLVDLMVNIEEATTHQLVVE